MLATNAATSVGMVTLASNGDTHLALSLGFASAIVTTIGTVILKIAEMHYSRSRRDDVGTNERKGGEK